MKRTIHMNRPADLKIPATMAPSPDLMAKPTPMLMVPPSPPLHSPTYMGGVFVGYMLRWWVVDFGDDVRSTVTGVTARSAVMTRTERTSTTCITSKSKKHKDVYPFLL